MSNTFLIKWGWSFFLSHACLLLFWSIYQKVWCSNLVKIWWLEFPKTFWSLCTNRQRIVSSIFLQPLEIYPSANLKSFLQQYWVCDASWNHWWYRLLRQFECLDSLWKIVKWDLLVLPRDLFFLYKLHYKIFQVHFGRSNRFDCCFRCLWGKSQLNQYQGSLCRNTTQEVSKFSSNLVITWISRDPQVFSSDSDNSQRIIGVQPNFMDSK